MEKKETFEFDEQEITVIADALAMYAAYNRQMVIPMLMGDESDIEKVRSEANTAQSLAREFYEIDRGKRWEDAALTFEQLEGRPMDFSDVSKFDFYKYMNGDLNR